MQVTIKLAAKLIALALVMGSFVYSFRWFVEVDSTLWAMKGLTQTGDFYESEYGLEKSILIEIDSQFVLYVYSLNEQEVIDAQCNSLQGEYIAIEKIQVKGYRLTEFLAGLCIPSSLNDEQRRSHLTRALELNARENLYQSAISGSIVLGFLMVISGILVAGFYVSAKIVSIVAERLRRFFP